MNVLHIAFSAVKSESESVKTIMLGESVISPTSLRTKVLDQTSGENSSPVIPDESELLVVSVLYTILALTGFLSNVSAIVSILTGERYLEVPTNWFILNQCIADLFMSTALTSMFIYYLHNPTEKIYLQPIAHLASISAIGSLALLVFNRALSIFDPFKYPRWMTVTRAIYLTFILWFLNLVSALLSGIGISMNSDVFYTRLARFLVIPIILVNLACYSYLFYKAKQHQQRIRSLQKAVRGQEQSLERDFKSFRTLVIEAGVHALCWVPCTFVLIVVDRDKDATTFFRCVAWTGMLCIFNSAFANPVIYFLRSEEFRLSLRHFKRYLDQHYFGIMINIF